MNDNATVYLGEKEHLIYYLFNFSIFLNNRKIQFSVNMWLCATCAFLGLLFLTVFDSSECLQTAVRPDKGLTVRCPLSCRWINVLCVQRPATPLWLWYLRRKSNCCSTAPSPEQGYTVTIASIIVQPQPSILTEFSRTFTWELKAPEKTVVSLDILGDGLMETGQPCSNGFQFSVATSKTNTNGRTEYCQGGSVTRLDLLNAAVVSLQVKPQAKVDSVGFQAYAGPLKGRTMVITVDSSTTVVLSRYEEPECEVCSVGGASPDCSPSEKTLTNVEKLSLEFGCLKPQDVYSVKTKKIIECTQSSCTPAAGEVEPDPFKDFKRSLTWDITVPERTVLTLDFPGGLKEISAAETCEDSHQYSVSTTKSDGNTQTKRYCKRAATTVTVEVPKDGELGPFNVKAAPRGKYSLSSRMMSVVPDPNTIITISRVTTEPDCSVCVNKGPKQKCESSVLALRDPGDTTVEFTCPQPQDFFTVEINREIDCTEAACSGNIVQAESSLFPDFNRTFTWDLKVVATKAFQLDFPEAGMRQIPNEETCPDEHTYSLVTYLRNGPATIGTFCKGGTVTTVLARYKGRMSLQVPGDRKLDPIDFKLNVGPETSSASETNFISANYPRDFPDEQQMQWDFMVPGMHNYTMHITDHTAPECLNNEVEVVYQKEGKKGTKVSLTDPQPQHQQGNFNMVLKNCETNQTLEGLSLNYRVSVMRSGHPVLCAVDLTKHTGVSLQIEKVGSDPYCEMSVNSKLEKKIMVAAGTKASLSFLDCPNEDVRLTASTDRTVELESPTGSLRQSLPGQECNKSVSLHVAEGDGFPVGDFCAQGMIQKVQVQGNVSVTATGRDFSKTGGQFLNVSYSQDIPESIIYRVSPKELPPTLLATPNWPQGMKPMSTVAWIVTVPSGYEAHVHFVNISQPKCKDRHTSIKVRMLGAEEEMMSRREDEKAEDKLTVPQSFYLNMSNCIPEEGEFAAQTKIILAILLGIAGALLLLLLVLGLYCFITKKKKQDKMNIESSIYMSKGNMFRPSDRHFTKTRSDNESHVYDSIDETRVYGHLLGDVSYADSMQDHYNGVQTDSYKTFMAACHQRADHEPEMDQFNSFLDPSQSFLPPRPRTPINRQDSIGFEDRRMVDNELYTFKSTGDITTIRLSGVDMDSQPPLY
ncbi:hypothetical protein F7725_025222 [Dissostichus mawsoni]|uniref:CUB domain-containing protein 1 n=1 Tax=Dissostichus mawsoni TaxID=36200 RepID=A0A7J5XCG2_DISMA|nr:hypothetical protein F7725_025222 [Dissostichus mawsoni]